MCVCMLILLPQPADEKAFTKQVKVLGFHMKVLLALVKEYDDYLLTSTSAIYRLILTIQRYIFYHL